MHRRHPALPDKLPKIWLMTDERMGDELWQALERLPRGAGVVFRHYSLPVAERRALFARIARVASRRRLVLVRAGNIVLGRAEKGVHGHHPRGSRGLRTWPAHNRAEILAGCRAGANLIFVSPIFATRSHPDARVLGRIGALMLMQGIDAHFVALGGMNKHRQRWAKSSGFYGWAAIDAWITPPAANQKRIAVPI